MPAIKGRNPIQMTLYKCRMYVFNGMCVMK